MGPLSHDPATSQVHGSDHVAPISPDRSEANFESGPAVHTGAEDTPQMIRDHNGRVLAQEKAARRPRPSTIYRRSRLADVGPVSFLLYCEAQPADRPQSGRLRQEIFELRRAEFAE